MKEVFYIAGIERRTGVSTKNGKDYDFSRVHALLPLVQRGNGHVVSGHGVCELDIESSCAVALMQTKLPAMFECDFSINQDGKVSVFGVRPVNNQKSAA